MEVQAVKDCTVDTTTHFIFEHILTRFGCPKIFMSDRDMHFVNEIIQALTEEVRIHHAKSTPYYLQENGIVEDFNKILEHGFTKVCNLY